MDLRLRGSVNMSAAPGLCRAESQDSAQLTQYFLSVLYHTAAYFFSLIISALLTEACGDG